MDQLTIVPSLSRPDAVQVETEGVFHTNNNTLTYQVHRTRHTHIHTYQLLEIFVLCALSR